MYSSIYSRVSSLVGVIIWCVLSVIWYLLTLDIPGSQCSGRIRSIQWLLMAHCGTMPSSAIVLTIYICNGSFNDQVFQLHLVHPSVKKLGIIYIYICMYVYIYIYTYDFSNLQDSVTLIEWIWFATPLIQLIHTSPYITVKSLLYDAPILNT